MTLDPGHGDGPWSARTDQQALMQLGVVRMGNARRRDVRGSDAMPRVFRYDSLYGRAGLRDRLRSVGASPRLVVGGTVAVLLVVVPAVVVVSLQATGTLWDDGGAVALLAMLLAGGAASVASVLHEGGKGSALETFARGNRLDHAHGIAVPEYAGSLFADGSHIVDQSVRTRDRAFAEVGDRFLIRAPRARYNPFLGRVQAEALHEPQLFLRGRLAGHIPAPEVIRVDGELHDRLTRFAGEHVIELAGEEATVYGSRRLDAREPGRVHEAFALLDDLVARIDTRFPRPAPTSYEVAPDADPRPRRTSKPLRLVVLTLALLVVVPLGFAFVMSIVDNHTRSRSVAVLAVNLLIASTGAVFVTLLRRATGRAREGGSTSRQWWPWLVGAVAFVALGVLAVRLDQGGTSVDDDRDKQSTAECYADDLWCQQDVSTRLWIEHHGLTRVGGSDWQGCEMAVGVDRSTCPVRVGCPEGHADLVVELAGQPLEVIGSRALGGPPGQSLQHTTAEIDRLVAQQCRSS